MRVANAFLSQYSEIEKLRFDYMDFNEENECGSTPLTVAVEKGYVTAVESLIKLGADPEKVNKHGNSALTLSQLRLAKHGKKDMLDVIESIRGTLPKTRVLYSG